MKVLLIFSKNYFQEPWDIVTHWKDRKVTVSSCLKTASFILVVPPLGFGAVCGINWLAGKVGCKTNRGTETLQELFNRTKVQRTGGDGSVEEEVVDLTAQDLKICTKICEEIKNDEIPSLEDLKQKCEDPQLDELGLSTLFNPPMTEILPGLYLGMQTNACISNEPIEKSKASCELFTKGIGKIITCTSEDHSDKMNRLEHVHLGIGDKPIGEMGEEEKKAAINTFKVNAEKIIEHIEESRKKGEAVLIHCNAGASRSPSFVIAYLKRKGLTFQEAYRYVKNKRLIVNVGNFEPILREFS